ncbi:hypothetical protein GGR50DRAFT_693760 [Xylaria sp. CBS 124048]|nr:hypothetical protein GGR50DRAFT_693760 [Xylaria sp. CBS 124048]
MLEVCLWWFVPADSTSPASPRARVRSHYALPTDPPMVRKEVIAAALIEVPRAERGRPHIQSGAKTLTRSQRNARVLKSPATLFVKGFNKFNLLPTDESTVGD